LYGSNSVSARINVIDKQSQGEWVGLQKKEKEERVDNERNSKCDASKPSSREKCEECKTQAIIPPSFKLEGVERDKMLNDKTIARQAVSQPKAAEKRFVRSIIMSWKSPKIEKPTIIP
jgi:hypothetical protein